MKIYTCKYLATRFGGRPAPVFEDYFQEKKSPGCARRFALENQHIQTISYLFQTVGAWKHLSFLM